MHDERWLRSIAVVLIVIILLVAAATYKAPAAQQPASSTQPSEADEQAQSAQRRQPSAAEPESGSASTPLSAAAERFYKPSAEFKEQDVLQVQGDILIIGINCTAIVAPTGPERAADLEAVLLGEAQQRPTAYDGWLAVLKTFNITLEAVTIHGISEQSFLSRAYFNRAGEVLDLDMRPSDAMNLAARAQATIYLNTTLLAEVGRDVCGEGQ